MYLNFIGNGSDFNINRGNNCAFLREDDKILFLDFGESIFERVIKGNLLKGVNLVYVAITHLHSDHVGSLPSLIFYTFYVKNIKTQIVSGDRLKDSELQKYFKLMGVNKKFYEFCPSTLNNSFKNIQTLKFTHVSHTKDLNHSYAITLNLLNRGNIYFSGDTNDLGYVKSTINNLQDKDEFYCDSCLADYPNNVHFNIKKLAEIVPYKKRKQVFCMHIDNESLIKEIKKLGFNFAEIYNGNIRKQE